MTFELANQRFFKRNKASCKRLGNIYDACQWMTKVCCKTNKGNKKITNFCTIMKVNKKTLNYVMVKKKK